MEQGYRAKLIDSAKLFRTNWIQFGEILTKVASERLYIDWGYRNFELYCKVELKIKKNTAIKLTQAYFFLVQDEPDLKDKQLDLDVILALKAARQSEDCSEEMFSELKEMAVKSGKSSATLKKKHKDFTKKEEDATQAQEFYKNTSASAKRLLQRIKPVGTIPGKYKEALNEMVSFFDAESGMSV